MNISMMYVAAAVAWTVIETSLTIARIEDDESHWLKRAMRRIREWSMKQSMPVSIGFRIFAGVALAIIAYIPVLIDSALWPVTVSLYVYINCRKED